MTDRPTDWSPLITVPPDIHGDPDAFEILRVWASKGKQIVSLRGLHARDPQAWGVFVADLVRHIARSYELNYGDNFDATVAKIIAAFEDEMDEVTDEGTGRLVDKDH